MCIRDRAYTSPLFEQALDATDLSESTKARIKQHVATYGSCQTLDELPAALRHAFVAVSYTHLDVYKRQTLASWRAFSSGARLVCGQCRTVKAVLACTRIRRNMS